MNKTFDLHRFGMVLRWDLLTNWKSYFYSINKKKYMHSVFHFFVLAGSICHIIAVWDILMKYI